MATPTSCTTIVVSWTDNSNNEDGFRIQRSTNGTIFGFLATVGPNVTSYTDNDVVPGTTYYYRVGAFNSCGYSNNDIAASAATNCPPPTPCPPPNAPTNTTATALSSSSIAVSWTDNSSNETGFRIQRSTNGTIFGFLANVGPNVTTYTDTGLTPGTTYYYRVGAFNSCGIANNPVPASATTLPGKAALERPATSSGRSR